MSKELLFGEEARERLKKGVDKIANAVKSTLGPGGRNVILQRGSLPHITKDGVTVAKDIFLEDPVENIGAEVIKKAAIKTGEIAGDGTTTSTVLAQALFSDGISGIEHFNSVEVKNGMDKTVKEVVSMLAALSTPIDGDMNKIRQVALVSSNNDKEIADLITNAMSQIKREGILTVEESKTEFTRIEVVEGTKIDRGYVSPYFVTNQEKMECVLINPYIIMHDKTIETVKEMIPLITQINEEKGCALFICEDMQGEALSALCLNKMEKVFKSAAIRTPGFGDIAEDYLEDIAIITGGSVISEKAGYSLEKVGIEILGRADKVIITKDSTIIIGGKGDKEDIGSRVNQIKAQIEQAENPATKDILKNRLAAIDGGVAVLYIGAQTEIEMKERKDRVDDALHATRAAVEEGFVAGGGIALLRVYKEIIQKTIGSTESELHGSSIVKRALTKPFEQIITNATGEYSNDMLQVVLKDEDKNFGFNSRTGKFGDMVEAGVIDPTKVVRVAIENAVSVAGTLLTTECISYNKVR